MSVISKRPAGLLLVTALAMAAPHALSAQQQDMPGSASQTTVFGTPPADLSELTEGPEIEGLISARNGDMLLVTREDGADEQIRISDGTEIRGTGGFLGLGRDKLAADSLLNGLPVTVRTVEWGGGLVASRIRFRNKDLKTASMIRSGTEQQFAQQGAAIDQNAAATEALRGRVGDIDKYNIKRTTNVYFDTGRAVLSAQDKAELCATASEAEATDNALMLVVGYTDSTGSQEFNQQLSEKRASRVVNYLQQACGWKPYRMLTPTGMAEADPAASNDTIEGKAQNRRVAVNVLVSKSVDGL
ncbi:MAG: OmpA family protein [Pseudomonadota bacterium]